MHSGFVLPIFVWGYVVHAFRQCAGRGVTWLTSARQTELHVPMIAHWPTVEHDQDAVGMCMCKRGLMCLGHLTDIFFRLHPYIGLFASTKITPNSYVVSYHGEIHSDERVDSDYDLALDRVGETSLGVDAAQRGNEARFVNDFRGVKPKPNAVFRLGRDNRGWLEMSVWSGSLTIKKGEEILVSYGKGWWKARTLDGDMVGTEACQT